MATSKRLSMLHFPEGQRFGCTTCGRCCRAPWNVVVDAPSAGRLRGSALELRVLQGCGAAPLTRDAEGRTVTAKVGGACVLLDRSSRCLVHSELGPEAKPRTCRQFPYTFRATPEGVFVGVSFFCPAVMANQGPLLSESAQEIRGLVAEEPLEEGAWGPGEWDAYRAFEDGLRWDLGREPVSAVLRRTLCALRGTSEASHHPALEAFTAARFLGWLEYPGAPPAGEDLARALRERRGRVRLPRFGWEGDVRALEESLARVAPSPDLEALLRRYLDALLFRKVLLEPRPLALGVALLHMVPPLLRWYAAASAGLRGAPAVEASDIARALEICELELVTHARGQDPLLADLVRMWA